MKPTNAGSCNTPLTELLKAVPITHRTEWEIQWAEDGTPTGHAICPIGKHCHDAADRVTELETRLELTPESMGHDGIYARDETIRLQDKQIKELEGVLAEYKKFAERVCRGDIGNTIMFEKMLKAILDKS